jgi:hypothetical protein
VSALDRLRDLGCEIHERGGSPAACEVRGPGGATIAVASADDPVAARAAAIAEAERALGLDPVDQASDQSFPASDAPKTGGPGL